MRAKPFNRLALVMGLSLCLSLPLAVTGCSSYPTDAAPTFSAMAMARIDPVAYGVDARRNAITVAEMHAREKLMGQVMEMRLKDGRVVQDVAILDPFMRAVIDDTIRGANVSDRTISDEGMVTVTLKVGLESILKMLEEYPLQLAEGGPGGPAQADAQPAAASADAPTSPGVAASAQ